MTTESLTKQAKEYIHQLTEHGHKVDCWSVKGSGKATEDCDIAIDVKGIHTFSVWPNSTVQENPYGKEPGDPLYEMTRIKFVM
jgi:hypothetical protein